MKVGSWLHNTIGFFIVILSAFLGFRNWPDSKLAALFFFAFAIIIAVLIFLFTKKRRELEREGK